MKNKGFADFHRADIKLEESEAEFYERVTKKGPIDPKQYPNLESAGLKGPYTDMKGVVYYEDPRDNMMYLPDNDTYVPKSKLSLPR